MFLFLAFGLGACFGVFLTALCVAASVDELVIYHPDSYEG